MNENQPEIRVFKVEGHATQTVDWTLVVQARDEADARMRAIRGIQTIYGPEMHEVKATKAEDISDEPFVVQAMIPVADEHPYPLTPGLHSVDEILEKSEALADYAADDGHFN